MKTRTMSALATVGLVAGIALAGESGPESEPQTTSYQVDMDGVREDFRDDGRLTVRLPDGDVTALVHEVCISEECKLGWSEMFEDGTVLHHESPDVFVEGELSSEPGSVVDLLLGEDGLYGSIERPAVDGEPARSYEFNPIEEPYGHFTQTVTLEHA